MLRLLSGAKSTRDAGLRRSRYWTRTFATRNFALWHNSPYEDRIWSLAYYRAFEVFLSEGEDDIRDRQTLLLNYCEGEFNVKDMENVIRRLEHRLPASSGVFDKYRRDACTLYSYPPFRFFGKPGNPDGDPNYTRLYDEAGIDEIEAEVYEFAKVLHRVAVRPQVIGDGDSSELQFNILTPGLFCYDPLPENPSLCSRIVYVTTDDEGETVLRSWDDTGVQDYLPGWKPKGDREDHDYGTPPFVLYNTKPGLSQRPQPGAEFDLLQEQMRANWVDFLSQSNAGLNGSPVRIAVNMYLKKNKVNMGLGRIVELNDIVSEKNAEFPFAPPSLEHFSPDDTHYMNLTEWGRGNMNRLLNQKGIPFSSLTENTTPQSGIARVVEREPLNVQRRKDRRAALRFSRELRHMIAKVWNENGPGPILPEDIEYGLSFRPEPVFTDPEAAYKLDYQRTFTDYTMALTDFASTWLVGWEGARDGKAIVKELQRNRELVDLLKVTPEPTPAEGVTEEEAVEEEVEEPTLPTNSDPNEKTKAPDVPEETQPED